MVQLKLPGKALIQPTVTRGGGGKLLGATVVAASTVGPLSRDGHADEGFVTEASETDVVQMHWENGIIELVSVRELMEQSDTVRDGDGTVKISPVRRHTGTTRGEGLKLDAVQHIAVKAAEKVADLAMPSIISTIEEEFVPKPGLYRVKPDGTPNGVAQGAELGQQPLLVLIHGTFSNSVDAFNDLYGSKEWEQLYAKYGEGRVLALEHRTVTVSPAQNARDLLQALPKQAELHLLTHSRGGLVGDLLCRKAWTDEEVDAAFGAKDQAGVRDELKALGRELRAAGRTVQVTRFLRVAAPAAGTQLAGRRLDQFVNVSLTMLSKVLGAGSNWFDFVRAIGVQLVSQRTKARVCPGLEAMMPDSPFQRFLNLAEPQGNELAVISGDVSGSRWFGLLKEVCVDFYFRRKQNDFVVDTASMTRGAPREKGLAYFLTGPDADHFSYFRDGEVRKRLLAFLGEGSDVGFGPLERGTEAIPTRSVLGYLSAVEPENAERRPHLPTVFVLPGIMGTQLGFEKDEVVWIHLKQLATGGGLQKLLFTSTNPVVAQGLLKAPYQRLVDALRERFNVHQFGFDWRRSIKESSDVLAEALREELRKSSATIYLLAHSMGGLVSRGLATWHRDIWEEIVKRGGRLVMLGTPNFGSFVPARAFTEQHEILRFLDVLDTNSNLKELTTVVRAFPGLIEMLPRGRVAVNEAPCDLLDAANWTELAEFQVDSNELRDARKVRDQLDQIDDRDKPAMVYVAGWSKATPGALEVEEKRIRFVPTAEGDGTVPWSLGRIDGVPTYYVKADHGGLPDHKKSFAGYIELLLDGSTKNLSRIAPEVPSGLKRDAAFADVDSGAEAPPEPELLYFPSEMDIVNAALGASEEDPEETETTLTVSTVNAHVYRARHPVVVGHYEGDPVTSVERVLDRWLDGQLTRDHALDIYPGRLGTMRWYQRGDDKARGVVVVGLGQYGTLTRRRLTDTLCQALLRYAADRFQLERPSGALNLSLSSLLVGSWGALSVEDSVCALIAAVRQCNRRLGADPARPVQYVGLELIDLYSDLASEAARVLQRLQESDRSTLRVVPLSRPSDEVRRQRPAAHTDYYRQIAISAGKRKPPQLFTYDVTTRLARTDVRPRRVQWNHVEGLLLRAPKGDSRAAQTLFQYLVPRELQPEAKDAADLVLQLDDWTAQVPWELLSPEEDDADGLVRRGVLRTLKIDSAPPVRSSASGKALVIGPPHGTTPPLPGAAREAQEVAKLLSDFGLITSPWNDLSADEVVAKLLEEPYDILHIAAHGSFDAKDPERSGVLLEAGRFLTAIEFESMKQPPSIVFLNCCHLGKIYLKEPGPWAASVAKQLIGMGVGVVVVAGWAVTDGPALTFARTLYRQLLQGENLMAAVREARRLTRVETSGNDVTWGAYQVYGAPGFTLPQQLRQTKAAPGQAHSGERLTDTFVSPTQLVELLDELRLRARDDHEKPGGALDRQLEALLKEVLEAWKTRGDVLAALGRLYAVLGRFDAAIAAYSEAVKHSDVSTGVIEQLANLEVREGVRLLEPSLQGQVLADEVVQRAAGYFRSSRQRLESLIQLGPSAERYALLGGTLRRFARFERQLGSPNLLAEASVAYSNAVALNAHNAFYPAMLVQSIGLLAEPPTATLEGIDEAVTLAKVHGNSDTYAVITVVELGLLRVILEAAQASPPSAPDPVAVAAFVTALNDAFSATGANQSERDSARSNLKTQADLAKNPTVQAWYRAAARALEQ